MGSERQSAKRKVYLYFQLRSGWHCQFLEPDLKTTAARPITFQDPAKIVEMAVRGGCLKDLASRQALDCGINMGRGSVWLWLTEEQYAMLKRRCVPKP